MQYELSPDLAQRVRLWRTKHGDRYITLQTGTPVHLIFHGKHVPPGHIAVLNALLATPMHTGEPTAVLYPEDVVALRDFLNVLIEVSGDIPTASDVIAVRGGLAECLDTEPSPEGAP